MVKLKLSVFITCFILIFASFSPSAEAGEQEKEEADLGQMVVTGTKTKRKTSEVPAAIDVITKEEIEQSKGLNIGEMLEALPGVQAQSKNGAYDNHIIIRGAGAKAAYGVREIMIMVDGIPITDPDSLTRLDVVDTSLIERIEVLKGPNSTLYGANAAAGVINIITKEALGYQGVSLKSTVGTDNSQNFNLSYGGAYTDKFYYFLSGSRRSTDSWRKHNEFDTNQLNGKFSYLIDNTSSFELLLSYSEADLQLPGSLTEEEFKDDPAQEGSNWPNNGRYSKTTGATLGYEKEFAGDNELSAQLYFQDWEHFHPVPRGINDGGANVYGAEFQLNIPHRFWDTKNVLTVGLSGQRDERDSKKYAYKDNNPEAPYTSSDDKGELMSSGNNTVDKWGVYIQESIRPFNNLIIDLGLRYDEVKFRLDEEDYLDWGYIFVRPPGESYFGYKEVENIIDEEKTWERLSPRIGINYILIDEISVYGTIGTGFQTPTQGELGTNYKLALQESVNYEVGLKGRFTGGHRLSLAMFYTSIEDEIIKLMDEDGYSFYDNAGETLHQGIELSGRIKLATGLYLGGAYAYSDFTFKEFNEMEKVDREVVTHCRDGNKIPLVPEHQYTFFMDYRHQSGLSSRISANTWEKYFVDTANSQTYKGFTVVSGKLAYDWGDAGIFFRVDNMFNKKYAAEVTESYGTIRYSPAAPRTWTAGISYRF